MVEHSGYTLVGDIDANSAQQVINLPDPVAPGDAVSSGFAESNYLGVSFATVQTSDASDTVLWEQDLDDNTTCNIEVDLVGMNKAVDQSVSGKMIGTVKRRGAGAVLEIGGIKIKAPTASTLDFKLDVDGNKVQVVVNGDATPNDVNWRGRIALVSIGTGEF